MWLFNTSTKVRPDFVYITMPPPDVYPEAMVRLYLNKSYPEHAISESSLIGLRCDSIRQRKSNFESHRRILTSCILFERLQMFKCAKETPHDLASDLAAYSARLSG